MHSEIAFDKLAGAFEVIDPAIDNSPIHLAIALPVDSTGLGLADFPLAATPASGRTASGRGFNEAQCRRSCLGEAAELLSSCVWGDEELTTAKAQDLGASALLPASLLGLSGQQYENRDTWNETMSALDWRPRPFDESVAIDWMKVCDAYSDRDYYAPADLVLIGRREDGDEAAVAVADSNGCACGADIDQAKLRATLELVERDAVGRWWYGQRGRPVPEAERTGIAPEFMRWLETRTRKAWPIDITTDLDIPAYVAVSCEPDGSNVALGSSANLDRDAAILSALTEMVQMEFSLELCRQMPGNSETWDTWLATVTMQTPPLNLRTTATAQEPVAAVQDDGNALEACLDQCRTAGVSLYFADLTREELGLPVFRALSTDLCHYKPRFGRTRLLADDSLDCCRHGPDTQVPNPQYLLV